MRTAIFLGLLRIAIAIEELPPSVADSLVWLIVAFIIADLVELVFKITREEK